MSDCPGGVEGTPTKDCSAHLSVGDCEGDTDPWGYGCCHWVGGAEGSCETTACANISNPDECPGCNKCSSDGDPTSGWEISEDRGSIPQDIYVEAGVAPQDIGDGINIPNGRTLYCAAIWMAKTLGGVKHIYVENGGAMYLYDYGSVPGF